MFNETFIEMSHCQYNFGENKIDTLPYFGELCLIFIFVPISPKSKNQHKFNYLNLLMLNETILEMPYCQLNFDKNNLEVIPLWGAWELISIFESTGPK